MVFVLSHMGLAQQLNLANQPTAQGVDYILGADTHERIREPLQGKFCKVTEPGAFASFVGKLDLVIENGKIKEETYALLDVDPEQYAEDGEMKRMVAAAREPFRAEIDKVIGQTRTPLLRYYVLETPMDNLITDALRWKFKPDFAVSNGFRFCPPLVPPPGGVADITDEFLWSMMPVDSQLKSGIVTGQQVVEWLERELENALAKDPTRRFGGWFVRFSGLQVTFTVANPAGSAGAGSDGPGRTARPREDLLGARVRARRRPGERGVPHPEGGRRPSPGRHRARGGDGYLALHSPVAPVVEGRAIATDAPADLLSQVEGTRVPVQVTRLPALYY